MINYFTIMENNTKINEKLEVKMIYAIVLLLIKYQKFFY